MTLAVIATVLAALGVALFALLPTFRPGQERSAAQTERQELEEERDALYRGIKDLERERERGLVDEDDYRRLRLRDETRAAVLLERLEDLPPSPVPATSPTGPSRPVWQTAAAILALLAAFAVTANAFAVWPMQRLSLRAEERRAYDAARHLPELQAKLDAESAGGKTPSLATLLEYGQTAWEMQDYENAAKAYSGVLRQDKGNPVALMRFGTLYFFSGENKPALEFLNGAIKLAPNDPQIADAYLNKGNLLFSSNDPKGAIEAFQKYQALAGDAASARTADLIAAAKNRLLESDPGAKLFARSCAGCHGAEAQGLIGPNLITSKNARDAAFVTRQIREGSRNGKMPAQRVTPQELEQLVRHVTTLK